MHMILLNIQSTKQLAIGFTQPADFLLHKHSDRALQDALAVLGTTDKMVSEFVDDVFQMLCFHPHQ
jgi:hypothetical protein